MSYNEGVLILCITPNLKSACPSINGRTDKRGLTLSLTLTIVSPEKETLLVQSPPLVPSKEPYLRAKR